MKRPVLFITLAYIFIIICISLFFPDNQSTNLYRSHKQTTRGIVLSTIRTSNSRAQFVLKITTSNHQKQKVMTTIWQKSSARSLSPGDVIDATGTFREADNKRNPGAFNYRTYLKAQHIAGLFSIQSYKDVRIIGQYHSPYISALKIKTKLIQTANTYFSKPSAHLITGMMLGDTQNDATLRENFSDAGISHIFAVSGLHVGIIYTTLAFFASLLKWSERKSLLLSLLVVILYTVLTGFSASVVRAAIMFGIPAYAKVSRHRTDRLSALCTAACVILLFSPYQLFTAGFQMSFCAVLAILLFYQPLMFKFVIEHQIEPNTILYEFCSNLILTFVATIGILPATLYHFQTVNFIGLLGNLIIVPIISILLPLCMILLPIMACAPICAPILSFLPELLATGMTWVVQRLAFLEFLIFHGKIHIILLLFIYCGLLILAGYITFETQFERLTVISLTVAGVGLMLIFFLQPKTLTITYLDVGQADCALIETPNGGAYLIDGGGYEDFTGHSVKRTPISKSVLLPALYTKGITHLQGAFISHDHADHAQGIEELAQIIPIDRIYVTTKYHGFFTKQHKIPVIVLCEGSKLKTQDGLSMTVLWPDAVQSNTPDDEQNEASMILKLQYGKRKFLFTGDASENTEAHLPENEIDADVLKVGHHGSNTASSEDFLQNVSPEIAVISVGRHNLYGHPKPQVLKRLKTVNAQIYRTDQNGAITIKTNGKNLQIETFLNKK